MAIRLALVTALALGCGTFGKEWDRLDVWGRVSPDQAEQCLNGDLEWSVRNGRLGPVPEDARVLAPELVLVTKEMPTVAKLYIFGAVSAEQAECLDSLEWNKRNDYLGAVPASALVSDPELSEMLRELEGRD